MAGADEVEQESLKDEIANLIEEARMVLPGIQALFGFQLIAVFNNANAIFSATGVRIRDLPLNPARIKQAIGV